MLSLWGDVADRGCGRKGPLGALADADQNALWSSDAYPPEMAIPARERFETTSAHPGLFRGSKVTTPTGFAVMSQTGREPAWLTTDFPCPRYDVSTNVDTGEPSTLVVLGANDQALRLPSVSVTRQIMSAP
jgi:hypothetical protein